MKFMVDSPLIAVELSRYWKSLGVDSVVEDFTQWSDVKLVNRLDPPPMWQEICEAFVAGYECRRHEET